MASERAIDETAAEASPPPAQNSAPAQTSTAPQAEGQAGPGSYFAAALEIAERNKTKEQEAPSDKSPAEEPPAAEESAAVENQSGSSEEREAFTPRERFDQVNTLVQAAEQKAQEAGQRAADYQEAMLLGLNSVDQLQGLRQEAATFGFSDTRAYLQAAQAQQQAETAIAETESRYDIPDEVKAEMVAAQRLHLQNQQQMLQTQQALSRVQQQQQQQFQKEQDAAISDARTRFGQALPANLETIFRQSSPEVILQVVAAVEEMNKNRDPNTIARWAAAKTDDRRLPAPEGRGGNPPPTAQPAGSKDDGRSSSWAAMMLPGRKA